MSNIRLKLLSQKKIYSSFLQNIGYNLQSSGKQNINEEMSIKNVSSESPFLLLSF